MSSAGGAYRVLVIDDDNDWRFFATRWLTRAGFDVVEARNGDEGLAQATQLAPDVVVLDVHMPGIDGFEVARRLRADPVTVDIPLIHRSLSAVDHEQIAEGYEAGAVAYLVEPVTEPVLVAAVNAAIRTRDQKRRLDLAMSQPGSGVFDWNVVSGQLTWSASLEVMHGFEPGTFGGSIEAFFETVDPRDRDRVGDQLEGVLAEDLVFEFHYRARTLAGDPVDIESSGRVFRDAEGQPAMLTGVSRDVTEREATRERSAALLRAATDLAASVTVAETLRILDDAVSVVGSSAALVRTEDGDADLVMTEPMSDDPSIVQFVDTLHRLGTTAIDRALLFEREQRIAGSLGRALLPSQAVDTSPYLVETRYEPATASERVGGDFFEIAAVGDRLVVAVGDVSGHGIGAASDMAQLRGALRAIAIETDGDPVAVLDRLAVLGARGFLDSRNTATVTVAGLDPSGHVELATAGHPAPILVTAAGSTVVDVPPRPLFGVAIEGATPRATIALSEGDELVFYTDGVIERRDEPVDVSMQRFADRLRPDMSLDEIVDGGARSDSRNDDDRVVVRIRR